MQEKEVKFQDEIQDICLYDQDHSTFRKVFHLNAIKTFDEIHHISDAIIAFWRWVLSPALFIHQWKLKICSKVPASFRHFHAVEIQKPLNQNVESDIV